MFIKMKGKNSQQNGENIKRIKTVETNPKKDQNTITKTIHINQIQGNTSIPLKALLLECKSDKDNWPKEMFKNVIKRFGRMPRNGWKLATNTYCDMFKVCISILDFKNMATKVLLNQAGQKCSQMKYKENVLNKLDKCDSLVEEKSLKETELFIKIQNTFKSQLKEIEKVNIDECQKTPKIFSETINHQAIYLINTIVQEHISSCKPGTMSEIARLIQTTQICYQIITKKNKKPSEWQNNILTKIRKNEDNIENLENFLKS